MRSLRNLVIITLATLLLLEVVLQAGALFVYFKHGKDTTSDRENRNILCVGDSWTFGMGAESADLAYPAQLERTLMERHPSAGFRTINCAYPGQNSRDVLAQLPTLLAEHQPEVTCILIGVNDFWSFPELLEDTGSAPQGGRKFEWRWRGGRLFALIGKRFGLLGDGSREAPESPSAHPHEGEAPAAETMEKPEPLQMPRKADPPFPYPGTDESLAYKVATWEANGGRDDPQAAANNMRKCLKLFPRDPQALQLSILAESILGNDLVVKNQLAILEEMYAEEPEFWLCTELLRALETTGDRRRRQKIAKEMAGHHPEYPFFLSVYAFECAEFEEFEEAKAATDKALTLSPTAEDYNLHEWVYGKLGNTVESTRSLIWEYLLSGDSEGLLNDLRARPNWHPQTAYDTVLAELDCSEGHLRELKRVGELAYNTSSDGAITIYETHLRKMIALCREHGSEPVLMNYPMPLPSEKENFIAEIVPPLADAENIFCVDHFRHFAEITVSRPFEELIASDGGHVNGEGYGIMAKHLADQLLEGKVIQP